MSNGLGSVTRSYVSSFNIDSAGKMQPFFEELSVAAQGRLIHSMKYALPVFFDRMTKNEIKRRIDFKKRRVESKSKEESVDSCYREI